MKDTLPIIPKLTIFRGDTKPDIMLTLLKSSDSAAAYYPTSSLVVFPEQCPQADTSALTNSTITGALDLSDSGTSVMCRFRKKNSETGNVFSVFCRKIGTGSTGGVMFQWPFFAMDGESGSYEMEVSIYTADGRVQTAINKLKFKLKDEFWHGGDIADHENARWYNGSLVLRNIDLGTWYQATIKDGLSIQVNYDSSITDEPIVRDEDVTARLISGRIKLMDISTGLFHDVYVTGSDSVPVLNVSSAIEQLDSSVSGVVEISTRAGRLFLKRTGTSKWHECELRGAVGAEYIKLKDGVA